MLLVVCVGAGCRTIRRISENRHSVSARKLSRQGIQAMHHGELENAEQLFVDALTLSDADDRAHRGLSEAYWQRGEKDLAVHHMQKAVQLSAGDPRLIGRLGEMYLDIGRLADAEQQCELALVAERESADIWALRGNCLRARGFDKNALAAYHRALALQPDLIRVKLQIGELYLKNNQYDRLLATLDQIDPVGDESSVPPRVHMLRGIAMRNLGQPALAAKHFVRAAESDPDRAEPHLQLAAIELENGRPDLASEAVAKAIQCDRELVQSTGWDAYLMTPEQIVASKAEEADADLQR